MRYLFAAVALVGSVGVPELARANGRAPAASSINFRMGHDNDIVVGLTFGELASHDNGATWYWTCEQAIGYEGTWDPQYAYTASGKLFATTYNGLHVNTDGCTFAVASAKFATSLDMAANGDLYMAVDDPSNSAGECQTANCNAIYRSTDDGATFAQVTAPNMPGMHDEWWNTLKSAKSDPARVYASEYHFVPEPSGEAGNIKKFGLWRSSDHAATFTEMSQVGLTTSSDSILEIVGIMPTDPDVVFLRVTNARGHVGDIIYRSTDAGAHWTAVLDQNDSMAVFVRANGDVLAGTQNDGIYLARDCGAAGACTGWSQLANAPHVNCFAENAAGELWACAANYSSPTVTGDGYALMKTTDYAAWTGVLRFQDITAPESCDPSTVHATTCVGQLWCGVRDQIHVTADPTSCPVTAGDLDDNGTTMITKPKKSGCCDTGAGAGDGIAFALTGCGVGLLVMRRRRRA